ncbi:MAG: hypothetical protein HWD86_09180 [Kangiellaceae bacterium]|nr:hypothetical protein [Kangiellaceae bacterium]
MTNLTTRAGLATLLVSLGITQAAAGHPVIDGVIGYGVGKAIEKHQEAGERLGYPPLMPPVPSGPTSDWHRQQLQEIERQRMERDLQRFEKMQRRNHTG